MVTYAVEMVRNGMTSSGNSTLRWDFLVPCRNFNMRTWAYNGLYYSVKWAPLKPFPLLRYYGICGGRGGL